MKNFQFHKVYTLVIFLFLTGCPTSKNEEYCHRVMVCQDDRESYCDKPTDGSCGTDCYYFVYENCWEMCEDEARRGGYLDE